MRYLTDFETLEHFYETLYSIPPRKNREITTPQLVTAHLLKQLGNPHQTYRSVLITGSKGKGSTALLLSSLINQTQLRVGRFVSPHLFDYRERIVVGDQMITESELLQLGRRVLQAANSLEITHSDQFPRFFEITTAIAYVYFAERYVDIAVIETGIGALTDATNQHRHEVSILTNIEDEHGDIFGTIEDIAQEKMGVIEPKRPLILGDLPESIDQIILNYAAQRHVPVTRFKRQFVPNNNGFYQVKVGQEYWITDSWVKAKNAWVALVAFQHLSLFLTDQDAINALETTQLLARQEIVSRQPCVIIDGAHSGESARSLANYVKKIVTFPVEKVFVLMSFSAKKNIIPVCSTLSDADSFIITQATQTRSLPTATIVEELASYTSVNIKEDSHPIKAYTKLLANLAPNDVLIVTGSVYLAGLISQYHHQQQKM